MNNETFQKVIEDILSVANFPVEEVRSFFNEEDGATWYTIRTNDSHLLIGKNGETLEALNHLIRKIIENKVRDTGPIPLLTIDINDFQKKKNENLKTIAHMMAERARFFKSSVEVDPMSSYERKVIHTFLSHMKDIKTESVGEGHSRRVVISYKEEDGLGNI
jgi:spoIIIJ-associated protein